MYCLSWWKKQPMCMYKCITGVGGKNIPCVCTHVLLELVGKKHSMCMYYWCCWKKPTTRCVCITGVGGKKHPMCMYYWSWKENTQCVCITGVGGKNTQICMYYWSWKKNTQCVCITGVGRKTSNVYVLLELVKKTPKCVCITGVGGRNTPCVCITHEANIKDDDHVFTLSRLCLKDIKCISSRNLS